MALIDEVKKVCDDLANAGWKGLLGRHGLNIAAADLKAELAKELDVRRDDPGFEDFAAEGRRGIEPGQPARSLLYHALASPNVVETFDHKRLTKFPTLAQLEVVENYVFGARPPSIPELASLAAGDLMAVVVFGVEYRVAVDTVHRKHADLCFSRTGVARVGVAPPLYDREARGFTVAADDPRAYRVLPARYAAFIATQRAGSERSFGPMRFNFRIKHPDLFGQGDGVSDENRNFWVPLHKLFDGAECLQGHPNLQVRLTDRHINEKLRRIHLEFARRKFNGGWRQPQIDKPPFRFSENIAAFAADPDAGTGLLVPAVHDTVVEAVQLDGKPLTYLVPKGSEIKSRSDFSPSLEITATGPTRRAPEYVHARTAPKLDPSDLNELDDPAATVKQGHYQAQHFTDFTGDGWIEAACPQLNAEFPRFVPAYSLVTAPDFYPNCDQREVMDWWLQRAPQRLRDFLWERPPLTLTDERRPPNLKLNNVDLKPPDPLAPKANFRPEDDTVTAIVSMPFMTDRQDRPLVPARSPSHSWLPDAAAGIFAPGWDTSFDRTDGVDHFAAYGLGSPFPEDSKLCAALSTFWPAVAPDSTRTYAQPRPTVSPMTDEEIGTIGNLPWDGIAGPRPVTVDGKELIEYPEFDHADYVKSAVQSRFTMALTSKVDTREYVTRVLAMARAYLAAGVPIDDSAKKADWQVLSFRKLGPNDSDLKRARTDAPGVPLGDEVYRVVLGNLRRAAKQPKDFTRVWLQATQQMILIVGGVPQVLVQSPAGPFVPQPVDA